ncbi:hypothetical protein BV25DRAFT_1921898 [Artomyces pyxidatus]|uniref:Uncharacterized protein n=1 Tax=Artomyces pyxidatus TaxID=48021 RepID=A0ACB8SG52_9AGAM|nr:hypothetical protein BV25DRAFT_1921898 [Artomyces pyxidatus]
MEASIIEDVKKTGTTLLYRACGIKDGKDMATEVNKVKESLRSRNLQKRPFDIPSESIFTTPTKIILPDPDRSLTPVTPSSCRLREAEQRDDPSCPAKCIRVASPSPSWDDCPASPTPLQHHVSKDSIALPQLPPPLVEQPICQASAPLHCIENRFQDDPYAPSSSRGGGVWPYKYFRTMAQGFTAMDQAAGGTQPGNFKMSFGPAASEYKKGTYCHNLRLWDWGISLRQKFWDAGPDALWSDFVAEVEAIPEELRPPPTTRPRRERALKQQHRTRTDCPTNRAVCHNPIAPGLADPASGSTDATGASTLVGTSGSCSAVNKTHNGAASSTKVCYDDENSLDAIGTHFDRLRPELNEIWADLSNALPTDLNADDGSWKAILQYFGKRDAEKIYSTLCAMYVDDLNLSLPVPYPDFIRDVLAPEAALLVVCEELGIPREEAVALLSMGNTI